MSHPHPPAAGRPPPLPPKVPKTPTQESPPPVLNASWGIASQGPSPGRRPVPQQQSQSQSQVQQQEQSYGYFPDHTQSHAHDYAHDYGQPDGGYGQYQPYAHKVTDTSVVSDCSSSAHNHHQEVAKRRKVRVLSLDGGGIRGYSTLVILTELMHVLHVQLYGKPPAHAKQLPKPADYFDIIGGNGTGGLIALMLGRMRMGVEECKQWYVELTRFVFITDKTVMGVPYGKTMFKKERLEQAIKECVGESTRHDNEPIQPPSLSASPEPSHRRRQSDTRSFSVSGRTGSGLLSRNKSIDSGSTRRPVAISGMGYEPRGNPNALLRDPRDGATRTFVTATYKGSSRSSPPVLLRTYPSRVESDPCPNAKIWEAGRATAATLSAFKPITIEQNTFLDEGHGKYNPAATVLTETVDNEFPAPDYEVGVFVSVGTGKRPGRGIVEEERPKWWEGVVSSPFENWTEARRRLIRKLEESERVHRRMIGEEGKSLLEQKGVAKENYYRFNVDVGVGEFAMNEWNRLPEVSTATRRYLHERDVALNIRECAEKLANIEKENRNWFPTGSTALDPPPNVAELSADIEETLSQITSPHTGPSSSAANVSPKTKPAIPSPARVPVPSASSPSAPIQTPSSPPMPSVSNSSVTHYAGVPGQPAGISGYHPKPPVARPQSPPAHSYPHYASPPAVENWIHSVHNPNRPNPPTGVGGGGGGVDVPAPLKIQKRKDSAGGGMPPPPPPPMVPPEPPIIRVTSPTTVAGDDSEEEEERRGGGRRRRLGGGRVPYPIDE